MISRESRSATATSVTMVKCPWILGSCASIPVRAVAPPSLCPVAIDLPRILKEDDVCEGVTQF